MHCQIAVELTAAGQVPYALGRIPEHGISKIGVVGPSCAAVSLGFRINRISERFQFRPREHTGQDGDPMFDDISFGLVETVGYGGNSVREGPQSLIILLCCSEPSLIVQVSR